MDTSININANIKDVIIDDATLKDHLYHQQNNYDEYISHLLLLNFKYNVKFTAMKKARIMAAAIQRNDKELANFLIDHCNYDLSIMLRVCQILDSCRNSRSFERKLEKVTNSKKKSKYKSIIKNLSTLHEGLHTSLTQAKIKFIKTNWINKISVEELEKMSIMYPVDSWKKIIDLLHLKPTDFKLHWFTKYVFEGIYPEDSLVAKCKNITKDNINNIINECPHEYLLKNHKELLENNIIDSIAKDLSINDILVDWNIFSKSDNILNILLERLNGDNNLRIPYGELMKRIQMLYTDKIKNNVTKFDPLIDKLIEIAQHKLETYKLHVQKPVVVIGDASASMDIAVRTSIIITSILCSICDAKLNLFRGEDDLITSPPRSVNDVINLEQLCKATGLTAPAASLYPYLEKKEIVKTFIIVTDEIENTGYDGKRVGHNSKITDEKCSDTGNEFSSPLFFNHVYKEYRETVYPAKLVFVSFVPNNRDGPMVADLKKIIPGIEKDIIQFRLNVKKPDLRKLDILLDTLAMEAGVYDNECNDLKHMLSEYHNNKLNIGNDIIHGRYRQNDYDNDGYSNDEFNEEIIISI